MRTQEIWADTIDKAAEEILQALKEKTNTTSTVGSRDNVFYFDGWDGLGASAVLRAIAQRLATTSADGKRALAELEFDQVIHIDCSMWQSRRALQRAVAEELRLPSEVMELFDREDEKDDFRGVAQGSRAEVQQVIREMQQHIQKLNRRFLVIFHNGSSEEIDLASCCGFPLYGFSTSKVLWTFQGRFRLKPRRKVDTAMKTAGTTDVFLLAYPQDKIKEELWTYLVLQETAEVAAACKFNTRSRGIINQPEQVTECFLYMWDLCCSGGQLIDYDLDTHGANYWVCDDIIRHRQQGDGLWRAAEALHREIRLDMDSHQYVPSSQLLGQWQIRTKPYWTSPTYGLILIPTRAMPNGDMFQHSADKLCVLKLSRCTFNFQSPPFLCCYALRFLWLDHCQGTNKTSTDGAGKEEDIRRCFQRLWVLDVRYTDCDQILCAQMLGLMTQLRELNVIGAKGWDMGQLQGQLPNICKLRVKKSDVTCSCPENDLFSEMNKMEHLDFSGNYSTGGSSPMTSLFGPGVSSSNVWCLETVIIVDGCGEVEKISFRGCTELKNLHLGGRMRSLHTLDISGTAVKTLDLSTTVIPHLDELYLLHCEKLCAILWPPKEKMKHGGLGKLCIDTTLSAPTAQSREEKAKRGTSTATTGTSVAPAAAPHGSRPSSEFDWHISVRDARLLASLKPVYSTAVGGDLLSYSRKAYVEISSPHPTAVGGGGKDEGIFKSAGSREQQLLANLQRQPAPTVYTEISVDRVQQASEGGADTLGIMWMWPCPDVPDLPEKMSFFFFWGASPEKRCYIHVQDQMRTKSLQGGEGTQTVAVPWFIRKCAKILHVHDSLSITSITSDDEYSSEWPDLEWCRIERCPKLDFVFDNVQGRFDFTYQLRIFWASQLLESRYISTSNGNRIFPHLTLLHLDFCPRLIHALPLTWNWFPNDKDSLCLLETLEIAWCGDLREIFPFKREKPDLKDFPKLKRIHLHELPSLQHICGVKMSAPNLETVNIRGCWSLTRLPDIGSSNKVVECDCEKEWWERLEWDDRSQADNYRPIHPRYYKKTLLRGSVLRFPRGIQPSIHHCCLCAPVGKMV
ncbi:unnamed protein product [Miscanthus lutarioriparius]|uniref:Disease resistance protein At4g27190-like leucine-rich repeats domain-containing protein n=1 Tax=Miscanthus lutarioriparius TaxID=422564 RepID=A0A811NFX8_9POAL|nr:unnamed protein product [Miscanthus lutarioriparius]